jgi:integrase
MPAEARGSLYDTAAGPGIRWWENGKRMHKSPFKNKRDARRWFAENVAPRLRDKGAPSPDITFDAFCDLFLERHGATVSARTKATLKERLAPARKTFGNWTLRDLEGAANDIAAWRARLSDGSRYRFTLAFRQALNAAARWRYITRNPATDAGKNPEPRGEEPTPFTPAELEAIDTELGRPLATFAAETGLRTNEWAALERRDVDVGGRAIQVVRRVSDGVVTPYPKTTRRRVPLTARALDAYRRLATRIDTPLVFPAPEGGYIHLDNFRNREWYDALDAAAIDKRGPYHLRHTFATEALAAGVSIFELSRLMGASVKTIDRHYGHLVRDAEDTIRARLDARPKPKSNRLGAEWASAESDD